MRWLVISIITASTTPKTKIVGMTKILMVCTANICRSPMALAVARQMTQATGQSLAFELDSAGTHAQTPGGRPDARAKAVLEKRGYVMGKTRSRRVNPQDFERFDLILAMDSLNLAALNRQCPPEHTAKLQLLLSFAPGLDTVEVPDPYFGNLTGFERALDLCEAGVRGLLQTRF